VVLIQDQTAICFARLLHNGVADSLFNYNTEGYPVFGSHLSLPILDTIELRQRPEMFGG
jgi:hypothetical protein